MDGKMKRLVKSIKQKTTKGLAKIVNKPVVAEDGSVIKNPRKYYAKPVKETAQAEDGSIIKDPAKYYAKKPKLSLRTIRKAQQGR